MSVSAVAETAVKHPPRPASIDPGVERVRHIVSLAVISLGLPAKEAERIAGGGDLPLGQFLVKIGILALADGAEGDSMPLLLTLDSQNSIDEMKQEDLLGLMVLSSTLLVHQLSIGLIANGSICLHRVVRHEELSVHGLASALRHLGDLAHDLWGDGRPEQRLS